MSRPVAVRISFLLLALCYALLPPLILARMISPEGPMWAVYAYGPALVALSASRQFARRPAGVLLAVLIAAGAVAVLVDILIVPDTAYLTWFRLAAEGNARGLVSFVFVITTAFLSSLLALPVERREVLLPGLGITLLGTLLAAFASGKPAFAAISVAVAAAALFLLAGRRLPLRARLAMVPSLVIFCAAVVGIGFAARALLPPRGNRLVDTVISPALRSGMLRAFPDFPMLYAIPGYGYSFESRPLGSAPVLSQQTLFHVQAPAGRTIYLRSAVYDRYGPAGWSLSDDAVKAAAPSQGSAAALYDPRFRAVSRGDIEVSLLGDFYPYIPSVLGERAFGFVPSELRSGAQRAGAERGGGRRSGAGARPGEEAPGGLPRQLQLEYGGPDTGYLLRVPLVRGDRILIRPGPPEADSGSLSDVSRYLELPESVPEDVRSAATSISTPLSAEADAGSELSVAGKIRSYIQDRTRYALDTREPPARTDLVEYFLFDNREGYCVHYATSFVVLARLCGIPARYVSGFLVNMPDRSDSRDVTGLAAHAWPEIWLRGRGWTIFEVTPPVEPGRYGDSEYYARLAQDRLMQRQLRALVGERLTAIPESGRTGAPARRGPVLPGWIFVVAVGAAAAFWLLVRLNRLTGGPERQFRRLCALMADRTERYGVQPPTRFGWSQWQRDAAARVSIRGQYRREGPRQKGSTGRAGRSAMLFHRAARLAHLRFFAGEAVGRRDVRFLRRLLRRVPRRLSVPSRRARSAARLDTDGTRGSL
ncbi:transglutaminase-like domain-containing protein [Salinispira pacifica]